MKKVMLWLSFVFLMYFLIFSSESENVMRLRVIANSDNVCDQMEKMKVVSALDSVFEKENFKTVFEAEGWIKNNMDKIEYVCSKTLKDNNYSIELCREDYTDGIYKSLVVTIGNGEGHNFWGTLFPDIALRASSSSGKDKEKGVLSLNGNVIGVRFWLFECIQKLF